MEARDKAWTELNTLTDWRVVAVEPLIGLASDVWGPSDYYYDIMNSLTKIVQP